MSETIEDVGGYVRVGPVEEIPVGTMKMYKIGRTQVTVANVRGKFYAFNNICLHRAGPLVEGRLLGNKVTCSWHAWMYDITTGKVMFPRDEERCLDTYPVKVEDEAVWVERPKEKSRRQGSEEPKAE